MAGPQYFTDKMSTDHDHFTRAAVHFGEKFSAKSRLASNSFGYKEAVLYNQLPREIKEVQSISLFKRRTKDWIRINISLV